MDAVMDSAAPARGVVERGSDAAKKPADVFRWATHVNVGDGAEDCPHGVDGQCDELAHFHAFCRLPNQFQHSDIRQRALAAKARRVRLLRDPDSDAFAVLDFEMAELERVGDREALIDELVNREFWRDQTAALRELADDDRFEHIDRDRERLAQLNELDPVDRDNDERDELVRHIAAYAEAIDAKRIEAQAPRRSALDGLDMHELVLQVREDRVQAEGSDAFMETYSKWEWFACTLKPTDGRPSERVFATLEDLESADRDVLDALGSAFTDLEAAFQRGPAGNS